MNRVAKRLGLTPNQLALAWVHNRGQRLGQRVIPIPGTTRTSHLRDNIAARSVELDDDALHTLTALNRSGTGASGTIAT